jgi:uncharacterized protein YjbJ (UPF0337 family)
MRLFAAASRQELKPGVKCRAGKVSNSRLSNRSNSHTNKDHIEGAAKQVVGSVKEAAGKVLENTRLESEGKIEKVVGTVQTAVGDVRETLNKSVDAPRQ